MANLKDTTISGATTISGVITFSSVQNVADNSTRLILVNNVISQVTGVTAAMNIPQTVLLTQFFS